MNGYSGDGVAATSAEVNYPLGIVLDSAGDILIADTNNCVIREVSAATGKISSIASTPGTCGYGGDGGVATSAQLYYPAAVSLDASGNMFIADGFNCVIRQVSASSGNTRTKRVVWRISGSHPQPPAYCAHCSSAAQPQEIHVTCVTKFSACCHVLALRPGLERDEWRSNGRRFPQKGGFPR